MQLLAHNSNKSQAYRVEFYCTRTESRLDCCFAVTNTIGMWNMPSDFSDDFTKNWGLWNFDVVEVFLQNNKESRYKEYQVSMDAKAFELEIYRPRISYATPLNSSFKYFVEDLADSKKIMIEIPIEKNESYSLGAFACLGQKSAREYYSLNPNIEVNVDFHRPELFKSLESICLEN